MRRCQGDVATDYFKKLCQGKIRDVLSGWQLALIGRAKASADSGGSACLMIAPCSSTVNIMRARRRGSRWLSWLGEGGGGGVILR